MVGGTYNTAYCFYNSYSKADRKYNQDSDSDVFTILSAEKLNKQGRLYSQSLVQGFLENFHKIITILDYGLRKIKLIYMLILVVIFLFFYRMRRRNSLSFRQGVVIKKFHKRMYDNISIIHI